MANTIGEIFRFTVFGESHGPMIGVTIEGIPSGFRVDMDSLAVFLERRRPGGGSLSTKRNEPDVPEFVSGLKGDVASGGPVTAVIRNRDVKSTDYLELEKVPRPGHADLAAMKKFGSARIAAGGGQFSGRLTAPICIAGGIALQLLKEMDVSVRAYPTEIGGMTSGEEMTKAIEKARDEGDSVGGIIECVIEGVPSGTGEPMFDGIENVLSRMVFGIPAVKGVEFGSGFAVAGMRGSENNDAFCFADTMSSGSHPSKPQGAYINGRDIVTKTNHSGGILGGIATGMPIVMRVAIKPTPSIAKEQDSVNIETGEEVRLSVKGRHDPCIVPRAVPVVEAAAAAGIYDLILLSMKTKRS